MILQMHWQNSVLACSRQTLAVMSIRSGFGSRDMTRAAVEEQSSATKRKIEPFSFMALRKMKIRFIAKRTERL